MGRLLTPKEKFEVCVNYVLKHEGRFSDDPHDAGGPTNFGISLRFLKLSHNDIDKNGEIDNRDLFVLDVNKAKAIYKLEWWQRYGYSKITSLAIAAKALDLSVNIGAKEANLLLQIAVNQVQGKKKPPLELDAVLGPLTISAMNTLTEDGFGQDLLGQIKDNATHYYINLCRDHPSLKRYLNGWLKRTAD